MEQERLAQEKAEKEKAEKTKKMKESFNDPTSQWEKDKTEMQNIAFQDNKKKKSSDGGAQDKLEKPAGVRQPVDKERADSAGKIVAKDDKKEAKI
jgi:mannan polymerase II complex ANP1 subunit